MAEKINKKRVLFIVTQSELGGAQRFLLELLRNLSAENYEFLVAVGRDGDESFSAAISKLNIKTRVINNLRRDAHPFQDLNAVFETRKLIKSFRPDTIFLSSSKAGFIGSLAAYWSGLNPNVIYRIGGWTFNDPWPNWKKKLWIYLERVSANWKDLIIVNNKHDYLQAKELNIKSRKEVVLIHNGIDPFKLEFLPREQARHELLGKASLIAERQLSPKYIVGTIANLYPTKGLEYIVQSAAILNDSETVFFIIGEGAERSNLETRIKELGLKDRVFILGRINGASRYLSAFDVYVQSSIKEGFPWSVLEAMSAKLPVVATIVGAMPEIIEDGVNGYLANPADPNDLAHAISKVFSNGPKMTAMSIQAHQTVVHKFTLNEMIKKTQELL